MFNEKKQAFGALSFNDVSVSAKPLDLHGLGASRRSKSISMRGELIGSQESLMLDVNAWLPRAAEQYNISPDLRDYVLHPAVVNVSGVPNTNSDAFELRDWLTFRPEFGQLAYKTFKGKPTFAEHQNNDHRKAYGAIFDAQLRMMPGYDANHARLFLLLAFDRNHDARLCNDILAGRHNTYSKGTWYKAYTCSICGETFTGRSKPCNHIKSRTTMMPDGRIAYRKCHVLEGFECSAVRNPAFICAAPDPSMVLDPRNKDRWQ